MSSVHDARLGALGLETSPSQKSTQDQAALQDRPGGGTSEIPAAVDAAGSGAWT
jgi:hypothetical protein